MWLQPNNMIQRLLPSLCGRTYSASKTARLLRAPTKKRAAKKKKKVVMDLKENSEPER